MRNALLVWIISRDDGCMGVGVGVGVGCCCWLPSVHRYWFGCGCGSTHWYLLRACSAPLMSECKVKSKSESNPSRIDYADEQRAR